MNLRQYASRTCDAFIAALVQKDYDGAYALMAASYRETHTPAAFLAGVKKSHILSTLTGASYPFALHTSMADLSTSEFLQLHSAAGVVGATCHAAKPTMNANYEITGLSLESAAIPYD